MIIFEFSNKEYEYLNKAIVLLKNEIDWYANEDMKNEHIMNKGSIIQWNKKLKDAVSVHDFLVKIYYHNQIERMSSKLMGSDLNHLYYDDQFLNCVNRTINLLDEISHEKGSFNGSPKELEPIIYFLESIDRYTPCSTHSICSFLNLDKNTNKDDLNNKLLELIQTNKIKRFPSQRDVLKWLYLNDTDKTQQFFNSVLSVNDEDLLSYYDLEDYLIQTNKNIHFDGEHYLLKL